MKDQDAKMKDQDVKMKYQDVKMKDQTAEIKNLHDVIKYQSKKINSLTLFIKTKFPEFDDM